MRALDTNVIVRLFVRDNAAQVATAEALLEEPFLVMPTVLVELVWVLTSRYGMPRDIVAEKLNVFLGLDNARVASVSAVSWALKQYMRGADFADMIHFALGNELEATRFATFDQRIKPHQIEDLTLVLERLS